METPVLFLIYNRPSKTKRVFEAIRTVKPTKLFIAADGPKDGDPNDFGVCEETRKITEKIDWKCEVKRLYRTKNLGLKKSISEALDWFFANVSEGIILEDDCLPSESFFDYCSEMLSSYRDDSRVMLIRGDNPLGELPSSLGNYYLSKYVGMWGWATWKRAWLLFDKQMSDWPKIKNEGKLEHVFDNYLERLYWHILFDATYQKKTNSWAYRWMFSVWKNHGTVVTPCANLVENIGFKGRKTHFTIRSFDITVSKITKPYIQIEDRSFINKAEKKMRDKFYGISPIMVLAQYIYYLIKYGFLRIVARLVSCNYFK